ncbi:MAG TPA: amidohydrolase family protein [Candidatus Sulfotelmatobacter sp.]|nr:amidohydrolase family protein [Candidatus Sulfotelmatobacter sp.]
MKAYYRHVVFFVFCVVLFSLATSAKDQGTLALVGGTVYASPNAEAVRDAVVLVADGRIAAVGKRGEVKIPKGAQVIDCAGKTIVAGFWNSHVHFIETFWSNAESGPAADLEKQMQEMLTRWGFTTVWDLGSDPGSSFALRRRVESGEVPGPKIFLAGDIFPKNGHPVYLPPEMQLPEAASAEQAAQMARDDLKMGYDGMKLFTGAFMGDKPVINMDTAIVKAAVDVAHARGKPVFAHPQNRVGLDNAIDGGVDILAHTIPSTDFHYTSEELARFEAQHTALIPTLTLWTTIANDKVFTDRIVQAGTEQLKAFLANGGTVLFGTDVGFIKVYDTSLEMEFMGRALAAKDVLASLTTNPASYFKVSSKGRVEKGMDADLVVLEGDPMADVRNLAKVAYTIRGGRIIFRK